MELTVQALFLAFVLGLLGFVEPCTVGAHVLYLRGQRAKPTRQRIKSLAAFFSARLLVMGGFGGFIVYLGHSLIDVQTTAWLAFGTLYLVLGLTMTSGIDRLLRRRISISPESWRIASDPTLQGLAFGLNIPACAAPILFGLIGTSAVSGSALSGFSTMAAFAFGLSLPLLPLSGLPALSERLDKWASWLARRRWLIGVVFIVLGVWSIWFGIFVDPVNWSRI